MSLAPYALFLFIPQHVILPVESSNLVWTLIPDEKSTWQVHPPCTADTLRQWDKAASYGEDAPLLTVELDRQTDEGPYQRINVYFPTSFNQTVSPAPQAWQMTYQLADSLQTLFGWSGTMASGERSLTDLADNPPATLVLNANSLNLHGLDISSLTTVVDGGVLYRVQRTEHLWFIQNSTGLGNEFPARRGGGSCGPESLDQALENILQATDVKHNDALQLWLRSHRVYLN